MLCVIITGIYTFEHLVFTLQEEQLFIAAERNNVGEMEFIITQAAVDVNWKNPEQVIMHYVLKMWANKRN